MYYGPNYDNQNSAKVTAHEILDRVLKRKREEDSSSHMSLGREVALNSLPDDLQCDPNGDDVVSDDATALSPKAAGASALSNKDIESNIKAVAPTAHPATAAMGVFSNSSLSKALAADADEQNNDVAVSLCSPNDELKNEKIGCTLEEDERCEEPAETSEPEADEPYLLQEVFDPNFFKGRIDFFDNGEVKNRTRYTLKLSVQIRPEDEPTDNMELFVNFVSRSRDFTSFLKRNDLQDFWYDRMWAHFEFVRARPYNYVIKPRIGVIKERVFNPDTKQHEYLVTSHAVAMLWQEQGKKPEILVGYSGWVLENFFLDAEFDRKHKNAPAARGLYVDPGRAHLDVAKKRRGIQATSRERFGL